MGVRLACSQNKKRNIVSVERKAGDKGGEEAGAQSYRRFRGHDKELE